MKNLQKYLMILGTIMLSIFIACQIGYEITYNSIYRFPIKLPYSTWFLNLKQGQDYLLLTLSLLSFLSDNLIYFSSKILLYFLRKITYLTNKKWYNQQVGLYVPFKNHFLQAPPQ